LTARQQSDPRALGRESHGQAFTDAAARAGDQNALSFDGMQESVLYFRGKAPVGTEGDASKFRPSIRNYR
jgi:hypothetical protein